MIARIADTHVWQAGYIVDGQGGGEQMNSV